MAKYAVLLLLQKSLTITLQLVYTELLLPRNYQCWTGIFPLSCSKREAPHIDFRRFSSVGFIDWLSTGPLCLKEWFGLDQTYTGL